MISRFTSRNTISHMIETFQIIIFLTDFIPEGISVSVYECECGMQD